MISNIVTLYVLVFISILCSSLSKIVIHTMAGKKYRSRDSLRAVEVIVKEYRARAAWSLIWPVRLILDLLYIFKNKKSQ